MSTSGTKLPPGPTGMLRALWHSYHDPLDHYLDNHRRYGELITLPTLQGPLVVTIAPEMIRSILTADGETCGPGGFETLRPLFWGESVVMMAGPEHRAARKLMAPPFHGARMRAYGAIIRQIARRRIALWPVGRAFPLQDKTQDISLDVILGTIFGVVDELDLYRFRAALLRWFAALNTFGPLLGIEPLRRSYGGIGPWATYLRRRGELEALMRPLIAERRADPGEREDILSLLLRARYDDGSAMTDADVMTQLVTLTAAGMETTAILLAWAVYELLRHPRVLERLYEEVVALGPDAEPEVVVRLPFLEAVLQETLRRWPGTTTLSRRLRKPMTLGGYELSPGQLVGAGLGVHFRPDLYPEPLKFDPERFRSRQYSPFEYLPFGSGHRRCIGFALATYQLKLVLAELVSTQLNGTLRLAEDRPLRAVLRTVTLNPEGGVSVIRLGSAAVPQR